MRRCMGLLAETLPLGDFVHIVENTSAPFNWKHARVREVDYPAVCVDKDMLVCLDSTPFESLARRDRK